MKYAFTRNCFENYEKMQFEGTGKYEVPSIKPTNIEKEEIDLIRFDFARKLDEKQVKNEINEMIERNPECGFTLVKVNFITYEEKLYGMPETVFLANATELPPRKNNETQEDE